MLYKPFQLLLRSELLRLNNVMLTGWSCAGSTLGVHPGLCNRISKNGSQIELIIA